MTRFADVNLREFSIYRPLVALTLILGICPSIFLETMHMSVLQVLSYKV